MILNDYKPTIDSSNDLVEKMFSISDLGIVFDILRNKLYSNPILAVCREISCNARDTHRATGKQNVAIEITLPNSLDSNYRVKDFGEGISPDRINDVFVKYTASTKREDNLQVGMWGIGSKTPLSISDSFTIITNYNGTQYHYVCYIDETKVGKLALLSECPTIACNGTEIIVPVKPIDFRNFAKWTEQATRHWDVKPIIKGDANFKYEEMVKTVEGKNWALIANNTWSREIKLIIDSIEYPLDLTALKTYSTSRLMDSLRGDLYLYFNTGDLQVSANRESVYLDKQTQQAIADRLDTVIAEIKNNIQGKIASFTDLWQAQTYVLKDLHKTFSCLDFLGTLTWKNISLVRQAPYLPCEVFSFSKGGGLYRKPAPNRICKSKNRYLEFADNVQLYINDADLKEIHGRSIKKPFEEDTTLKSIIIVCPDTTNTLKKLNDTYHLDKMNPKLLSSILKQSKAPSGAAAKAKLILYKYIIGSGFSHVAKYDYENDTNTKVLCVISNDDISRKKQLLIKTKLVSADYLTILSKKFPLISFYGIDEEIYDEKKDNLEDFQDFEEFAEENVLNNCNIDFNIVKYVAGCEYDIDAKLITNGPKLRKSIVNKDSVMLKKLDLHEKMNKIYESGKNLLSLYESINGTCDVKTWIQNNPDKNLETMESQYKAQYPLIQYLSYYRFDEVFGEIVHYINLIDKE